jgi:hypothetical protein
VAYLRIRRQCVGPQTHRNGRLSDAVQLLDVMLGQFSKAAAKPKFESRPLTVALREGAVFDYTAGLGSVSVLNDGIFLMLWHRDAPVMVAKPPLYLGDYGRLVPKKPVSSKLPDSDDYADLSYAVKRRVVRLDPGL